MTEPAPAPRRPSLRVEAAAVLLVVLSLAFIVPFWDEPPGRDQGIFLAEAAMMLDGASLYVDVWENKPPGVLLLYAAALGTFGRTYGVIQVLDWLAGLITALALMGLVRHATGRTGLGVAAGALYLAYAGGVLFGGFWVTGQPEVFMDPLIVGALLLLRTRDQATARGRLAVLGAGALTGLVVVLKYSALPLLLLGLLHPFRQDRGLLPRLGTLARFGAGMAVAGLLVVAGFALAGSFDALLDATVRFNQVYRTHYALDADFTLHRIFGAPTMLLVLYLWAAAAVLDRLMRVGSRGRAPTDPLFAAGLLLWALSVAQVFWQGKFWDYHYHVVLLPLCLLAAVGIGRTLDRLPARIPGWVAGLGLLVLSLGLMTDYAGYCEAYGQTHQLPQRIRGEVDEATFLDTYIWGETDYSYQDSAAAALRIRETTEPDDRIVVWGYETLVYFLAERAPASRFVYDFPLMPRFVEIHAEHVEQLMADLTAHPPALFVAVVRDANVLEPQDSLTQLQHIEPLKQWLMAGYVPAWSRGDFRAFRRRDAGAQPSTGGSP